MRICPVTGLAMVLALAGCATLPSQTIRFAGLSDCPDNSASELLQQSSQLGFSSSTHRLECALTVVRESSDPSLVRSALPSRLALHLAERETDKTRKEALANEGVNLAQRALTKGGDRDGAVYYYLAANLGLAIHDHPLQAADHLTLLEQSLNKAVQLNPAVDDGGPLRLLGMLYLKAPPWPTGMGDGDKALDLLRQAVDRFPQQPLNHLFYAQALWEVDEQSGPAKSVMETGRARLEQGAWGYNKAIWAREFEAVAKEIPGAGN